MSAGILKCRYGNVGRSDQVPCERNAAPGWTTCYRHHSAGISRAMYQRLLADRAARPAQYFRTMDMPAQPAEEEKS